MSTGARAVVEKFEGPVVLPTGVGSFDFVRLAPHFAQDDRVNGGHYRWDRGQELRATS
jgi:hypothetical protein